LHYESKATPQQPGLADDLMRRGIRSLGITALVFKPIDQHRFVLAYGSADKNGDYSATQLFQLNTLRLSGAVLYGWKKHARKMVAFGISRTYRGGQLNYIPVLLFNWTSRSGKWGCELLLPARGAVRYRIAPKHLLMAGFEIEGQTYKLNGLENYAPPLSHFELRRSELKLRAIYEYNIHKNIWLSIQAGYRINNGFKCDIVAKGSDIYRGFSSTPPYFLKANLSNTYYGMITLAYAVQ
jgi:hypothetical protein